MTYSTFFREEFSGLDLHDKRLVERAISIGNRLLSVPGSCIQSLFDCHNAARCAYDFFSNPKVECSSIFSVHQDKSTQRIVDDHTDTLYLLQDSTYYNYTWHTAKLDLCRIGKQGRFTQLGVIQHSTLCLNGDGLPLGLLELEFLGHETQDACAAIRGRSESLFSQRWRRFTLQSLSRLSQCEKKKIFLCDREADFFEHLYDLSHASCDYVIRSKWDRPVGDWYRKPDSKLSLLLEKTDSLGSLQLSVTDPYTHEERITTVTFKSLSQVRIPPRYRGVGHPQNNLEPVVLNVVEAKTKDETWRLLTSLPVTTAEEVCFVINAYKKRWHIESFYKVLKTAYKADQIYLHSSREAIENLLTIINIAAFRTYWVIHQARQNPNEKAIHYFKKQEIIAIDIYTMRQKRNKPNKTKTLKDMYYKIATLGGYKNTRNTHPPGILTIYRGLQKLQNITEMYNAMTIEKYVTKT